MRRYLRILTVFALIAAPLATARAQTLTAAKIDSINKAVDAFVALAKDSSTTGKPPRYSDPAIKPLLDTAFDTKGMQGGKPLPWSSVTLLQDWNRAVTKIGLVYYLAGTGAATPDAVSKDPAKTAKANSNTPAFAEEFGRYYDTQIRILSAILDTAAAERAAATDDRKKDPAFRSTLQGISDSAANTITGVMGSFLLDGVTDDWAMLRLVALLDIAPRAAKFMSPDDREQVKNAAHEVAIAVKNKDVRSGLNFVTRAFEML